MVVEETALALAPSPDSPAAIMERVIIAGDLAALTPEERVVYYLRVCESIGLNPLTRPFDYITLNGKLTLYPNKDAAAQLRKVQNITIADLRKELIGEIYVVTIFGRLGSRDDVATGAVSVRGLQGESLANAYMKAETKAKRRLSLSLAGLGFADESEIEGIPTAPPADEVAPAPSLAERAQAKVQELEAAKGLALAPVAPDPAPEPDPAESEPPVTLTDGISRAAFAALLKTHRIAREFAMAQAHSSFPEWNGRDELTDAQRGILWRDLMPETGR
jgi:hypothetical protein